MKSISSKTLVSKFTTAVRGVVSLRNQSMRFLGFGLATIFFGLFMSSQLANATGTRMTDCPSGGNTSAARSTCITQFANIPLYNECFSQSCATNVTDALAGRCQNWQNNVQTQHQRFTDACSRIGGGSVQGCRDRARECQNAQSRIDAESEDDEDCDTTGSTACPELYAGRGQDLREEQRQADQDRRDAQKQIADITKQIGDAQSDLAKKQTELRQDMEKAAMDFRKAERELMDQLKKTLDEIDGQQAQAIDKAQEAYRAMDAEYVKMRDKLRRLQSNINRMRDGQLAQCRGAAQAKYQVAEEARLKARNQGPQNRGSMSSLAGDERRRAQRDMRSRQSDYTAFYNECMAGQSPEGRAAQNNINKAQDELKDEEKLIADQSAMLEKQRLEIIQKLKQLEETAKVKKQEAYARVQQQLQTLRETFEMNQRQNQERMQMAQQEAMQKQQNLQNQLGQAQQQAQQAQITGNSRARQRRCMGRGGQMSESEGGRRTEAINSVPLTYATLAGLCNAPPTASCGSPLCSGFGRATGGSPSGGAPVAQ
jgi:hypothetical protein